MAVPGEGPRSRASQYVSLNEIVKEDMLKPQASPLQIIRNPKVPLLCAEISNVVATYKLVGPRGEKLTLNRKAIADMTRVSICFRCNFQKSNSLVCHVSLAGPSHHATPMAYDTSSTHQLADPSPEQALLTAHAFAHELSVKLGCRVRPSPIRTHNFVACIDTGRKIDLNIIRRIAGLTAKPRKTKRPQHNSKKEFSGQTISSKRVSSAVFSFFESGMVNCCGAPSVEHVRVTMEELQLLLEEHDRLLRGDALRLAYEPGPLNSDQLLLQQANNALRLPSSPSAGLCFCVFGFFDFFFDRSGFLHPPGTSHFCSVRLASSAAVTVQVGPQTPIWTERLDFFLGSCDFQTFF